MEYTFVKMTCRQPEVGLARLEIHKPFWHDDHNGVTVLSNIILIEIGIFQALL